MLSTALVMDAALVGVNQFCGKNTVPDSAYKLFQSSEQS